MKTCESRLSDVERKRNQHGPMQVYVYTDEDLGRRIDSDERKTIFIQ